MSESFKAVCVAVGAPELLCDIQEPGFLNHVIACTTVQAKWSVTIDDREPVVYMTTPHDPTWDWFPLRGAFDRLRVEVTNLDGTYPNGLAADVYLTVEL